jgi:hypothetical protein
LALALATFTAAAAEMPKSAGGRRHFTNSIGMKMVLIARR